MQDIIRELVYEGLEKFGVNGATVAVVKDGEVLLADGFGYADREKDIPMTEEYALPIGSSSKAFTGTAAMILVDDGKLDIDKPVREYMSRFWLNDPVAYDVTVRDMLCHRTGLPRHDLFWITWPGISRDDLVFNRLRHLKANKPFRSKWEYNNHMYAAVGMLVEEVSGRSWEEFTRERIFTPLGMKKSFFWQDDPQGIKQPKLYKDVDGTIVAVDSQRVTAMGPAGSIRATISDMVRWLEFNLSGGKIGEEVLLKEESFAELWKPVINYELMPFKPPETHNVGYGLGWFIDSYRGEKRINHGGNVTGATALVSMLPEKSIGIVVLANHNSTFFTYALSSKIQDLLMERPCETDWFAFYKEKFDETKKTMDEKFDELRKALPDKPMSRDATEFVGEYSHAGYGDISVTLDKDADDSLLLNMHGNVFPLIHKHYDVFRVEIHDIPVSVIFRTGVDGGVLGVDIKMEMALEEMITYIRVD